MSFAFLLKKFTQKNVKSAFFTFSSQKNKIPLINLKKTKEELLMNSFEKAEKNFDKNYQENTIKNEKNEKKSLQKYFIIKEKEISSKILKATTEKEVMNIYYEENHKK